MRTSTGSDGGKEPPEANAVASNASGPEGRGVRAAPAVAVATRRSAVVLSRSSYADDAAVASPGAMQRPLHAAKVLDGTLRFELPEDKGRHRALSVSLGGGTPAKRSSARAWRRPTTTSR